MTFTSLPHRINQIKVKLNVQELGLLSKGLSL